MKTMYHDLGINNYIVVPDNKYIEKDIKKIIEIKNLEIDDIKLYDYREQIQKLKYEVTVLTNKNSKHSKEKEQQEETNVQTKKDLLIIWVDLKKSKEEILESIEKQVAAYGY